MKLRLVPKYIVLKTSFLKNEFGADEVSSELFQQNYARITNIMENPEKFPQADFDYLQKLEQTMFNEAPSACILPHIVELRA